MKLVYASEEYAKISAKMIEVKSMTVGRLPILSHP